MSDRKMNERKKQLGLFLDNSEMWRCEGRLANADLHYDVKCPMILHCDHHFTSLVVKWEHHQVLHKVMRETVTELKNRYWVINGRALVNRIVQQCILCKCFEATSYREPPPPPLLLLRVHEKPPFTFVGVDLLA
jgi:hypothetical protein